MTTIPINGQDVPATRIDELASTVSPSRNHVVPAMSDGMTVGLTVGQILALLENAAGINANSVTVSNANSAPLGGFARINVTEANAAAANCPALGGSGIRWWNIETFGEPTRTAQFAQEVFGVGTVKGRMFYRVKHDAAWSSWSEIATMDAVNSMLPLAGGTVTGPARFNGPVGFGRDASVAGVFYVHRSGQPSIILSSGPSATPTTIGRIQADDSRFGITNATGSQWLLYINAADGLPYAAGNPTNPLGLATKGYVDAAVAAVDQGVGQTWQNMLGSRTTATAYQNTTGRTIWVAISWSSASDKAVQMSDNGTSWVNLTNTQSTTIVFPVRNGEYYRVSAATTLATWTERF